MMTSMATGKQRLKAFAWDYVIISLYLILLMVIGVMFNLWAGEWLATVLVRPWQRDLFAFSVSVLPVSAYFALMEGGRWQATWGKRRVGIRVVDSDGARLSKRQSWVRAAVKFLPWQVAHTSLFHIPGWPMAATVPPMWVSVGLIGAQLFVLLSVAALVMGRQRLVHDWLSGSQVVADVEVDDDR